MTMDKPLESVLGDDWDRDAFMVQFKKKQVQDLLITQITKLVRAKDIDGALELVKEAKEAAGDDLRAVAAMVRMEAQILMMPIREKLQSDETAEEGQAELMELVKNSPDDSAAQIRTMAVSLLMSMKKTDVAAVLLNEIAALEKITANDLNALAWNIYLQSQRDRNFSEEVLKGALAIAEKAVATEPQNSMIIDTLAHLAHRTGDLDRALELQTKAVEEPGEGITVNDEMKAFLEQLKKEKAGE